MRRRAGDNQGPGGVWRLPGVEPGLVDSALLHQRRHLVIGQAQELL